MWNSGHPPKIFTSPRCLHTLQSHKHEPGTGWVKKNMRRFVCLLLVLVTSATDKLAYMFITPSRLPLELVWQDYFANASPSQYSIYVHAPPGVVLDASTSDVALFHNRTVAGSVLAEWGQLSLVEAELVLFSAALEDTNNAWFILLSETTYPVRSFEFTYTYALGSRMSFMEVNSWEDFGRYHNDFDRNAIPREVWKKGSQWAMLTREDARVLVRNQSVVDEMRRVKRAGGYLAPMDEFYKQTTLLLNGRDNYKRQITWLDMFGAHPFTMDVPVTVVPAGRDNEHFKYVPAEEHPAFLRKVQSELCQDADKWRHCFLFARKATAPFASSVFSLVKEFEVSEWADIKRLAEAVKVKMDPPV